MFTAAGKWIDDRFLGFRDWLDKKLVPSWRIWWKLRSMQLGALFAALITFVSAVPNTLTTVINSMPPWLQNSLPAWVGPLTLAILFLTRFWDQSHVKPAPQNPSISVPLDTKELIQPAGVHHGAE